MSETLSDDLRSLRIERDPKVRTPSRGRWAWWAAATLAVGTTGVVAANAVTTRLRRPQVRVGEVVSLSPAHADVTLVGTGHVLPLRHAVVASRLVGRVARMPVSEGEDVKEGQLVAELESYDAQAAIAENRAALETARARVRAARAELDDAQLQLARDRELHAAGSTSRSTVDASASRVAVADARVAAAEAEVGSTAARLQAAESLLRDAYLRAPFAGRVVRKIVEVGEVPTAASGGPGGLVEIVDFDSLIVEADVSEGRLMHVRVGGPAEITLDAFPGRRLRGRVTEIRPVVDRQRATVVARVKFEDSSKGVLPNMAARVLFLGREQSAEALVEPARTVVPASAVVERSGATFVFVVSEGRVHLTSVQLGGAVGEGREVRAGAAPGARVVLDPPRSLEDGDPIKEKV